MPRGAAAQLLQTACRVGRVCRLSSLPSLSALKACFFSPLFFFYLFLFSSSSLLFFPILLSSSPSFSSFSSSTSSSSYSSSTSSSSSISSCAWRLLRSTPGRRPCTDEINKALSLSPLPSSQFEWFPRQEILHSIYTSHSHKTPCHVRKDQLLLWRTYW